MIFVNEILSAHIQEYSPILKERGTGFYCSSSTKTSGIMVCALHLEQFLVAKRKYLCTSNAEGDFWFEGLGRLKC